MTQDPAANRHADAVPHSNPASPQDAPYYYVERNVIPFITAYRDAEPFKLSNSMAARGGGGWRNREGTQFFIDERIDHTEWHMPEGHYAFIDGNTYHIKIKMCMETLGDQFVTWHMELYVKNIHASPRGLDGDMEKMESFYQHVGTCDRAAFKGRALDPLSEFKWHAFEIFADKLWPLQKSASALDPIGVNEPNRTSRLAWINAALPKKVSTVTLIQL